MTYEETTKEYRRIRRHLWDKTGHICAGCGAPATQLHHIVPRHMGGHNNIENIVALCGECHAKAHEKRGAFKNGKADLKKYHAEMRLKQVLQLIEETQQLIEETNHIIEKSKRMNEKHERTQEKIEHIITMGTARRRLEYMRGMK